MPPVPRQPADAAALRRNLDAALAGIRARVDAAARRAGRDPAAVTVVAVTKTVGPDVVAALAALGHRDFGENRPADLVAKRAALGSPPGERPVTWHMIGHLQRNKIRRALASIDVLHSVDSLALAEAVSAEVARLLRPPVAAFVQCNVSGEETKGGFEADEARDAIRRLAALPGLSLRGLMTMAPAVADPETVRPVFRRLRELGDWAAASGYLRGLELSMGMSEDFDVAVEEGATLVRVGRALVGSEQG